MKYSNGDYVDGTTLYVSDTFYNKVRCRCQICGLEGVYTEDELEGKTGCKYCAEFKLAKHRIKPTTEMNEADKLIKKFANGDYKGMSNFISHVQKANGLAVDQLFNDLKLEYFIAKIKRANNSVSYANPHLAILTCRYCGVYKRKISLDELSQYNETEEQREKYKCPHCNAIVEKSKNESKEFIHGKRKHASKIIARSEANRLSSVKDDGTSKLIHRVKTVADNVKEGSQLDKLMKRVKELNPSLDIRDVEPSGSSYTVHCTCNKCGTDIIIPGTKKSKKADCPGCKKKETDANYIGRFDKDYRGVSKNILTLIDRQDELCTVKCEHCKNIHDGIKFYDWYKGKVICECSKNNINGDEYCKNCGSPMNIPFKTLVNTQDKSIEAVCDKCGKNSGFTIQELYNYFIAAESDKYTKVNKLGFAAKELKQNVENVTEYLVKSKEPLYVGTDGNLYYKCICLEHDTSMILNNDEISIFDHEQCADVRQHIMKDITKENIKF